jgi:hypothetical protein
VSLKSVVAGAAIAVSTLVIGQVPQSARASTIDWTVWDPSSVATGSVSGSAAGSAGGVGVKYTGELENLYFNYPSWGPPATFSGGTVGNPPLPADGIIQLFGSTGAIDKITFATPVTNPVMAIWSLGQTGIDASFVFGSTEPFAIESGGPSSEYGGSSIFTTSPCAAGSACGIEGNGTIQFIGTYSSISWTNPTFEDWYGFTVGVAQTPLPSTWTMLIAGFLGLGLLSYLGAKKKSAALTA